MVEVGRLAAVDGSVAATLAALEQQGFYERSLALQSCYGSRDGAHVVRAMSDPSSSIRALASQLLPMACDDTQVEEALEVVTRAYRRRLLRKLRQRGRQMPIDAYIRAQIAADDPQADRLLPFASPDLVREHLKETLDRTDSQGWTALARWHPALVVGALQQRLAAAPEIDSRLLWRANAALIGLAVAAPDQALTLAHMLLPRTALSRLQLQPLARRRPLGTVRLLLSVAAEGETAALDSIGGSHHVAARAALHLRDDEIVALLDRHVLYTFSQRGHWFGRLPPQRRLAVYRLAGRGLRNQNGVLPDHVVALLPRSEREQEGRRHLALATLATEPQQRLPYAAFLPWEEARAALEPFLHNPDAKLRALALHTLIDATRYQRERLPELLDLLVARRHEQDPVRGQMLAALADLPPGCWRLEQLATLNQMLHDALDAADLSPASAQAMLGLLVNLLPGQPDWAIPWLATLTQERGELRFYRLWQWLNAADVQRLASALFPVLQSWRRMERDQQLLTLAAGLGKRLRVFDGLVDLLADLAQTTRSATDANEALQLLAAYRPQYLATLVPALLRQDRSAVTLPVATAYLHRRRQDLLTPFLLGRGVRGRFSTGKTAFVPAVDRGFARWTPRQQQRFAETLVEVIRDPERDTLTILTGIRRLAALPAIAPTALIELAAGEAAAVLELPPPRRGVPNARPVRRRTTTRQEAALRALGRLDAGQGIPTLLAALEDERARVAIYALRQAVLTMPVPRALEILRAAPVERVTVAKEVVRLFGDLATDEAWRELLRLDQGDLQRDVRVALLRALWSFPDRPETWPILERAAQSPDAALAMAASRVPAERLLPWAQQRLLAVHVTLLRHADPAVRQAALLRCVDLPVADPERLLLPHLLAAVAAPLPQERSAAAAALFSTYTTRDLPAIGEALAILLPNRRALETILAALLVSGQFSRREHHAAARTVLAALAGDPLTATSRVELAMQQLSGDELAGYLQQLAKRGELHAEALMAAVHALGNRFGVGFPMALAMARVSRAGGLSWRIRSIVLRTLRPAPENRPSSDDLARLEAALAAQADERLRRIALAALIAQSSDHRRWDAERLARLRVFRADASPMVAGAAQFTLPVEELE